MELAASVKSEELIRAAELVPYYEMEADDLQWLKEVLHNLRCTWGRKSVAEPELIAGMLNHLLIKKRVKDVTDELGIEATSLSNIMFYLGYVKRRVLYNSLEDKIEDIRGEANV